MENKKIKDKNNVKHNMGYMRQIAEERCGRCLSTGYVNNKTKLLWECEKKHQWSARPDRIICGGWCPYCAKRIKYTLGYCKEIAIKKEGDCLSKEYINSQHPMEWVCSKGHKWKNSFSGILNAKQWCHYCYGNVKHTIEEMEELAKKYGGQCLSNEYKGNKVKLKWKCKEGHIWEAKPNDISTGHWCPACGLKQAAMKNRFSLNELRELAKKRDGKLLSEVYIDGKHKLKWECSAGHVFFMTSIMANFGQWCPICAGRDKSERIARKFFETIFNKPFPKTRPKWLINESGRRLELDGYNEELKLAFEFQGMQHYTFVPQFHKSRTLEETKRIDLLKRDLCEQNGIKLIIIPYHFKIRNLQAYILSRCKKMDVPVPDIKYQIDYNSFDIYSPKKLKDIQSIAESKGGICFSKGYIDRDTKLRFRCKNGHEWETTPRCILRGNWCRKCSGYEKKTIEDIKKLAESKGGRCLSNKYKNVMTKLKWVCKEGHVWETAPINIIVGHWCPLCAHRVKLSLDCFQDIAKQKGGECLSTEYINNKTKLKFICKEKHIWMAKPAHIKNGHWCPRCARKKKIECTLSL